MTSEAASSSGVPAAVRAIVAEWCANSHAPQPAIRWPRDRWIRELKTYRSVFESFPDLLGREQVRSFARSAASSSSDATVAFLAVMCWGFGSVGYGPYRTRRVLDHPDAPEILLKVAQKLRQDGAARAYDYLATDGRLKGLGPAFGSKYLYFCPQSISEPPALILDAVVSRSIKKHGDGLLFRSVIWDTRVYSDYLKTMTLWSEVLGVPPGQLEECLFRAEATGQWQKSDPSLES